MSSFNMNDTFNFGNCDNNDLLDASTAALLVECFETTTLTDDIHHANSDDSSTTSVPHESDNNDRKPSPHEWQHDTSVHTDQTSVVLSDDSCDDVESKLYSLARKYNRCWDFPPRIVHSYEKCYRNLPRYAIVLGSKRNSKCKDFECTIIYRELRGTKYTPLEVLYYKLISRFQKEYLSNKDFEFLPAHEDHLLFLKEEIDPHHPDTYIYKAIKHVDRDETILSDIKNCGRRDKEDRKFDRPTLEEYIEFLYIEIQIKRRALDRMPSLHPMNSEYIPTVNKVLESLEATINEGIAGIEGVQKHRILLKNTWELYFPSLTPKKKRKKNESTDPDNNDHSVNNTNNTGHYNGNNDMPDQSNSNTDGSDTPGSFYREGDYTGGGCTGDAMSNYDNTYHRASDICDESSTESSMSPWKYDSSSDDDDDEEENGDDNNDYGAGGISWVKSEDRTPSTNILQFQRLPVLPSGQSDEANSFIANESEQSIAADITILNSDSEGANLTIEISKQFIDTDDIMLLNDMKISKTDSNTTEQQKHISSQELPKPIVARLDEGRPSIENVIGNDVKNKNGEQEKIFLEAAKMLSSNRNTKSLSSSSSSSSTTNTNSTPQSPCTTTTNTKTVQNFLEEARNGNLKKVKDCIKDGVDKEAKDVDGRTALHYASRNGHLKIVQYLIETCSVNKEAKANDGQTALFYASYNKQPDIVRYFIKTCRPEAKDDIFECEALHSACTWGLLDEVRYLIDTCHVNAEARENNDGWNALHIASCNGELSIVEYLVEKCRVDTEITSKNETAYDIARRYNRRRVANYLKMKANQRNDTRPSLQSEATHHTVNEQERQKVKAAVVDGSRTIH